MIVLFWICLCLAGYTYLGYGIVLYCLVRLKKAFFTASPCSFSEEELPELTLIVAAYNEAAYIDEKI